MLRSRISVFFFFISVSCVFCQTTDSLNIVSRKLKFGYVEIDSARKIDVVIVHSSYCPTQTDSFNLDCILNLYKKYDVSAHYIIDRSGTIYSLVEEKNIAHHGGKGFLPDNDNRPNSRSIGIELINTQAQVYTEWQYIALTQLVKNIKVRYPIKYVLGHSDIAPTRKTDPWNFDWAKFNIMLNEE